MKEDDYYSNIPQWVKDSNIRSAKIFNNCPYSKKEIEKDIKTSKRKFWEDIFKWG